MKQTIHDILTWLIGEKAILKDSLHAKEIDEIEYARRINNAIARCVTEINSLKFEAKDGLVALDENKIEDLIGNLQPWTSKDIAKAICSKFGQPSPAVVRVEFIQKILIALHQVTGEVYLGDITGTSEKIKALLTD